MNETKYLLTTLFLALVLWGCGDNGTGVDTDEGEPPEIPAITAAQPDFSYFEDSQKAWKETQSEHAFSSAQTTVMSAQFLFAFSQISAAYFQMAENQEATYEDGHWEWNYSASIEGQSVEFQLIADVNEAANQVKWEFYISSTGGDYELDNFKYMEGTTSLDGESGDWKVYDFVEGSSTTPVMTYEWETDSDGNMSATFNFNDEDAISTIAYVQDGNTHTLTLSEGAGYNMEIFWDAENDQGYLWDKAEDQKLCWTTGKSDISCSDIGF